jgi:hypothetical protein
LVLRRAGAGAYLANNDDGVVLTTPTRLIVDFEVRNWYFIANSSFEVCGTDGHTDGWESNDLNLIRLDYPLRFSRGCLLRVDVAVADN